MACQVDMAGLATDSRREEKNNSWLMVGRVTARRGEAAARRDERGERGGDGRRRECIASCLDLAMADLGGRARSSSSLSSGPSSPASRRPVLQLTPVSSTRTVASLGSPRYSSANGGVPRFKRGHVRTVATRRPLRCRRTSKRSSWPV